MRNTISLDFFLVVSITHTYKTLNFSLYIYIHCTPLHIFQMQLSVLYKNKEKYKIKKFLRLIIILFFLLLLLVYLPLLNK